MTTKTPHILFFILSSLATVACGSGDTESGLDAESMQESDDTIGPEVGGTNSSDGGDDLCNQRQPEDIVFDQVFWSAGFKVTLEDGKYLAATPRCPSAFLLIESKFENRAGEAAFDTRLLLNSGGVDHEGEIDSPVVPGQRTGKGLMYFESEDGFDLADAVLIAGNTGEHLAKVPLGEQDPESAVTLEPVSLELDDEEFESDQLHFQVTRAGVRADTGRWHRNLDDEVVQVRFWIDVTSKGDQELASSDYFYVELPDGTSVSASSYGENQLLAPNETMKDLYLTFDVDYPAEGKYLLSGRAHGTSDTRGEFQFELPALSYGP